MRFLAFILLLGITYVQAQNTRQLNEGETSPKATLSAVSWLQGHWQGEAFGGVAEEIWSPPKGGSMMFVFRLVNDNKITFYEVGHIKETKGTLILQLKHFDGNLIGWEEKNDTVDFKLVKLEENTIYFEGMTIERINTDRVKFYVVVEEGGKTEELVFDYQKIP